MKKKRLSTIPVVLIFVCTALIFVSFSTLLGQDLKSNQLQVPSTTVVLGTDNPLIDVPAVQAAVDQGGSVILKGTFDFGTDAGNHIIVPGRPYPDQDRKGSSTVFIYRKDVTIKGETGPQGELLTVVKNGRPPFWIGWDGDILRVQPPGTNGVDFGVETFPVDAEGRVDYRDTGPEPNYLSSQTRYARAFAKVNVTIESIYFDSPQHYGVKATAGHDVFVIGNVFRNVKFGGLVHANNVFTASSIAAAFIAAGSIYAPFVFPAFTGRVVAERNIIDGSGTEPINTHAGECFGLGALGTNAVVRIERNEIRNVGRELDGAGSNATAGGILLVDNYSESLLVAHNLVYNSSGYGIYDLAVFAPTPGPTLEHNTLINCVTGILTYSFKGPRRGVVIHQNSISQDSMLGQSCIVANNLSASLIRANTFEGEYSGPLVVVLNSSNCTFLENRDLRSPIPPWPPTYFLDGTSSGNLVQAPFGTALDMGTNNSVFLQSSGG